MTVNNNYNYRITEIKDFVTDQRNHPEKYIEDITINGFVHLILKFINNLKPISHRVELEFFSDRKGIMKFHICQEFQMNNWFKVAYCPTTLYIPEFMPLNAYSKKFKLRLYNEENRLKYESKFVEGRPVASHDEMENSKCHLVEFHFILDDKIWSSDILLRPKQIISLMRNFAPDFAESNIQIFKTDENKE